MEKELSEKDAKRLAELRERETKRRRTEQALQNATPKQMATKYRGVTGLLVKQRFNDNEEFEKIQRKYIK
jgi:hypothetical protein